MPKHPVEMVSWDDAVLYCQELTESERRAGRLPAGYVYRLPTEAEWEYAARGGPKGRSTEYTGSNNLEEVAWNSLNSGGQTHPVGQKKANELGLKDMSGNVWEWCHDWYQNSYNGLGEVDPTGPASGSGRVDRGGSWGHGASDCRVAYRSYWLPTSANTGLGFRVVLAPQLGSGSVDDQCDPLAGSVPQSAADAQTGSNAKKTPAPGTEETLVLPGGVELVFCWCPATRSEAWKQISGGEDFFRMGSPEEELGRSDNETLHAVKLTRGFWMGKYPLTQRQWEAIAVENLSEFQDDSDAPVENVSWDDAQQWLAKANRALGRAGLRLPTEAEWEYACRAGTTSALNSGRDVTTEEGFCPCLDEVGWYDANSENQTHAVGELAPNAWGLHDMHGNVWERCQDWYGDYPVGTVVDPVGPGSGSGRVIRGGSWNNGARYCRSAPRGFRPDFRNRGLGLRLLRTVPPSGDR